ncbi:MAG TPA: BNR repeat-containing protein [Phnomibacter sp.]|nr:BNR repeat-containing protein [Phnomibacter sp.]
MKTQRSWEKNFWGQPACPIGQRVSLLVAIGFALLWLPIGGISQTVQKIKLVPVDSGWAANSINAVVFRKNSIVSNGQWQYIAFYDKEAKVVLGKRKLGSKEWQLAKTAFKGNAKDAHNSISIMVDGDGFLHLAWNHHNNPLHYSKSVAPGSLDMGAEMAMTGIAESSVSYPEFYRIAKGNLLFLYRDGGSGKGNLVMNSYNIQTKQWAQVQQNLIDGEGNRNAYWQACTDAKGSIHLSWVWRESPDVASNHDMCYARSDDGGKTWQRSDGTKYQLPITATNAEYAWRIPQNSELINQTSMATDEEGHPFIATYWRNEKDTVPQLRVIYSEGGAWKMSNTAFRKTAFTLGGMGTKSIPISRPQVLVSKAGGKTNVTLVFRDEERGRKISVANTADIQKGKWAVADVWEQPVGAWEPSYDTEYWKQKKELHLFVQLVQQADGEGILATKPTMIYVLEWKPAL